MADTDLFKLELTSIASDGDGYAIRGSFTNKSDKTLAYKLQDLAVNGIHCSDFSDSGIAEAGKTKTFELKADASANEAGDFKFVQIEAEVQNSDTEETLFNEVLSAYPYGEKEIYRSVYNTSILCKAVYKDGTVEIYLISSETDDKGSAVTSCVNNLTNDVIEVEINSCTYSGTEQKPSSFIGSFTVFGLNSRDTGIALLPSDLSEEGLSLDKLETLEVNFTIKDLSDGTTAVNQKQSSFLSDQLLNSNNSEEDFYYITLV